MPLEAFCHNKIYLVFFLFFLYKTLKWVQKFFFAFILNKCTSIYLARIENSYLNQKETIFEPKQVSSIANIGEF